MFLDRLKQARAFAGSFAKAAPWQSLVILNGGKLYASDNQQIVEIECGVEGSAVFSARTKDLLASFKDEPTDIKVGDWIEFTWDDGRHLRVRNDYDHDDVVEHIKALLDTWHGHREVTKIKIKGRGIEVKPGKAVVGGKIIPRSGFFYTPGTGTPSQRIVAGDADLRNDDFFQVAKEELETANKANKRQKKRLIKERQHIEKELARVNRALAKDEERIAAFDEAVAKYKRGEELSNEEKERLRPSCESVVKKAEGEEIKAAVRELPQPPDTLKGWEKCADRTDGEYAYITYRHRLPETEVRKSAVKRIEQVVDEVFADDFPRDALLPVWQSLTPIEPRAGPS